jgi:hypothetical protein
MRCSHLCEQITGAHTLLILIPLWLRELRAGSNFKHEIANITPMLPCMCQ